MLSPPHRALFSTIQDVTDYLDTKGVDYSHIIKRRDPKEPGRRRKEAMEVELYRWCRRYWRAQAKAIRDKLSFKFPDRKALDVPDTDFLLADFNGDPLMAQLKKLLIKASQDGVLLFSEMTPIGIDYTLTNVEAAKWASEYAGMLVTRIDGTTMDAVRSAVTTFVETPGFTVGDTMRMLPFTDSRAVMVSVTEITRSYAEGNQLAGDALAKEFSGVRVIKRWFTNYDSLVCDICGPLHNKVVLHDKAFIGGDNQTYYNPPAHINCRCWTSQTTDITESEVLQGEDINV